MTPKDYSVDAQPASEDIANLEQMLEGMEFRAAPIELAALNRLFARARTKAQALEARVAAAEQDTRPTLADIESWLRGARVTFVDPETRKDYGYRGSAEIAASLFRAAASHNSGSGGALGAIPQEESQK